MIQKSIERWYNTHDTEVPKVVVYHTFYDFCMIQRSLEWWYITHFIIFALYRGP